MHSAVKEAPMSKKVLILSGSPRKGGNSDILCDEFLRGAENSMAKAKVEINANNNCPIIIKYLRKTGNRSSRHRLPQQCKGCEQV